MNKTNMSVKTQDMITTGMSAALLAVFTQLAIPSPSGVPMTLQTFMVALLGVVLGAKRGLFAVLIYLLIGFVGVPVFTNFQGGPGVFFGKTGGFLFGFPIMVMLCGIRIFHQKLSQKVSRILMIMLGFAGLLLCHLLGILQFHFVTKMDMRSAWLLVSLPYIGKDLVSVVLAYLAGNKIKKRLP